MSPYLLYVFAGNNYVKPVVITRVKSKVSASAEYRADCNVTTALQSLLEAMIGLRRLICVWSEPWMRMKMSEQRHPQLVEAF